MKNLVLVIILQMISFQTCFSQWNRVIGMGDRFVYSIRKIDSYLFAATDSGVYRSDDGISWQQKITGMDPAQLNTREFCKSGNNLYAASLAGLYVSTDYGDMWQFSNYPYPFTPAISVFAINNIVLASTTGGGLYRSSDNGNTWIGVSGDHFWKYAMINGKLFASSFQDVLISPDTGRTWQSTAFNDWAFDLLNVNDTLLVTTFSNSIGQTPTNTMSWSYLNSLQIDSTFEFARSSDTIFVSAPKDVYYFKDKNESAKSISLDGLNVFPENELTSVEVFNNLLLVGTENQSTLLGKGIWYYHLSAISGIHNSIAPGNIEMFPNPTSGWINLRLKGQPIIRIEIFNILGQKLYTEKYSDYKTSINISSFPRGIYFIKATLTPSNICRTQKIIKN